jgi:catechol 2,3-dioxygenase-like lactoylglutathione lyase family enzyme
MTAGAAKIGHADLKKSIAFYHDLLGLQLKSQHGDFATLESGNVGVLL